MYIPDVLFLRLTILYGFMYYWASTITFSPTNKNYNVLLHYLKERM